jgi:hypothetical protein
MIEFYIYFHITLDTNEIFYIGKGKKSRAWSKRNRNKLWHNISAKHGYKVEIIFKTYKENEAFDLEIKKIEELKPRANLTNGGQGTSGLKHDPVLVAFRNKKNKELNATPEGKLTKSLAQKEAQNRPEVKEKVKLGLRKYYENLKNNNILHPLKGIPRSDKVKKRISESQKGEKGFWHGKTTAVAKKVINLNTKQIFNSVGEAALSVNGCRMSLTRSLKKRNGLFKKQRFQYLEDYVGNVD